VTARPVRCNGWFGAVLFVVLLLVSCLTSAYRRPWALGLPVFALQFHPKAAYLHLAADGFTFCSLFRAHTVRWEYVREFAVIYVGPNRMVGWNFTPDYPATGRARAISKSLSGYEAALPDTYGMRPEELVGLMESIRQRYVETRSA